jgi:hypothetical protein
VLQPLLLQAPNRVLGAARNRKGSLHAGRFLHHALVDGNWRLRTIPCPWKTVAPSLFNSAQGTTSPTRTNTLTSHLAPDPAANDRLTLFLEARRIQPRLRYLHHLNISAKKQQDLYKSRCILRTPDLVSFFSFWIYCTLTRLFNLLCGLALVLLLFFCIIGFTATWGSFLFLLSFPFSSCGTGVWG